MSRPRISVVIPHLNQPELLDACLSRLARQQGAAPAEVLVVDNGSRPDLSPRAVCDAHPGTRLLHEPRPGPGPARNLGAAEAVGDVVAFTDSDCLPAPDWLARLEAAFADPTAEIVAGAVRIARADPARATALEAYESVYSFRTRDYVAEGWSATANTAVRADLLRRIGPFGGIDIAEDIDWGRRATAMGIGIRHADDALVEHPARPRFGDLAAKWERLTLHQWTPARRSLRGRIAWGGKALALMLSPPAEIPRILTAPQLSGARERRLAFAVLTRSRLQRGLLMLRLLAGAGLSADDVWNRG